MSESITARITRLQRELEAMREFQQRYLVRRRADGIRTATDRTIESHQRTIVETLDLLEAVKAIILSEETP